MKIKTIVMPALVISAIILTLLIIDNSKGYIAIDTEGASLQLNGGSFTSMTLHSGDAPVEVPAKSYTPQRITLTARKNNDTWNLESTGPWGTLSRFKVEEGKTKTLQFGPPLTIETKTSVIGKDISIDLAIFGKAGEQYRNVITKNGDRVSAPKVEIIDQQGQVLISGQFQYG